MATKQVEAPLEDHRVRVGAQRREKTKLKLLESALTVFADKGPDVAVIDDFIAAAGVSRGTFYNHFRTTNELMLALAAAMSDEVLQIVDPIVLKLDDPIARVAAGTRMYMQMALRYPLWGGFITRVGTRIATRGQLIDEYLSRDLEAARKAKRIQVDSVTVARDIVLGSIFYGIETMLTEPTQSHHPEHILRSVLVGFGLDPKEAEAIAYMPLAVPSSVDGPIFSGMKPRKSGARAALRA
ncbi:TetR/AcrR family transcriptional regulator [Variovorax sp. J22R133]|uniref:TetR/AcrR family transcriptional regulator n=1 Tax=Variovorax brevis TaxID=3053503 RepID=UPI002574DA51|nr:TetR/AcrR family transcriptional regulator [Variovorax sp. J22R133]MDM0114753.1 TetR/AcrR family transcriptional regulator [Variovorax sp. J22R133]